MKNNLVNALGWVILILLLAGCNDDGPTSFTVNFTNAEITVDESATINVIFSRPAPESGTLMIGINGGALQYGEAEDFYTVPAAVDDVIEAPFSAGDIGLSVAFFEGLGLNIQQNDSISITLQAGSNIVVGPIPMATVIFSENFVASGGNAELVAGPDFTNQVFFDLSKITGMSVRRSSWDIAFHTGSGFFVALNSAAGVMARSTGQSVMESVTAEDSVGFGTTMVTNGFAPSGSTAWVDAPTGDLDSTAIGRLGVQPTEVFIVKGASGRWQKAQFARNSEGGYEFIYGDIGSPDFQSETITKDASRNFFFFSFSDGIVTVEPPAANWDLSYSSYISIIEDDFELPLLTDDIITINRADTRIAPIRSNGPVSYEDFTREDAMGLTVFSSDVNAVGSSWRTSADPPAVSTDRFFVLQDSEGNYYKFLIEALTNAGGERGHLTFTYERL